MSGTTPPRLVILDVNETLSDMGSLADALAVIGAPTGSDATWFAATLRDGFALTAAAGSPVFPEIATDALRAVISPHVEGPGKLDEAVGSAMAVFTAG